MGDRAAQDDWIKRVLGLDVGTPTSADAIGAAAIVAPLQDTLEPGSADGTSIVALWVKVTDEADRQLKELYEMLRAPRHTVLAAAAERIESALSSYRTGLTSALLEYDHATGPGRDTARQNALRTVITSKANIAIDKYVIAAETNPFGVSVSVRAAWDAALDLIKQRLMSA